MRVKCLVFLALVALIPAGFAQQTGQAPTPSTVGQSSPGAASIPLAISTPDYPVTPGDTFTLSYYQAGVLSNVSILVQSDYGIDLGFFGKVNALGKTFAQLKPIVSQMVSNIYPRGAPSLSISSLGAFLVLVKGEVPQTRYVQAWGLSRLSEIVAQAAGPFSSLRDVQVVLKDGTSIQYDLYKAKRLGAEDQDPYVKPGETIVLSRAALTVQMKGEVQVPGAYQLLPGEDLATLIKDYGRGLTSDGEGSRVAIDRYSQATVKTLFVDVTQTSDDPIALQDGDVVRVPSITAGLPVVYFEGAVIPAAITTPSAGAAPQAPASPPAAGPSPAPGQAALGELSGYSRVTYAFRKGETLYDAVLAVRSSISPLANLRAASIMTVGTQPRGVDLERLLSVDDSTRAIPLEPFERIMIPFTGFFVFISGSVTNPGSYPYSPNQNYRYYLALVGAPEPENPQGSIIITNAEGNPRGFTDLIQPGDTITVAPSQVTVWGAVVSPGNFTFAPGHDASYYIGLAGGIDSNKNTNGAYAVTDSRGKARDLKDQLRPGDRIHMLENSFVYNFNLYFPVIGSTVALVAAVAGITQVIIGLLPK